MREGKVYFILPVLALVLATLVYLIFVSSMQSFGPEGTRLNNILDFYQEIPEGSLILFGESQVRENIDCNILEENYDINCYNLGVNGIMPMQLALQKDLLISAKPRTVVLSVSPSAFDESINQNEDLYMIMGSHDIKIDSFMEKRLYDREKELLSYNFYELALHKRKFIIPFYLAVFKQIISPVDVSESVVKNFKNPHFFNRDESFEELSAKLDNPKIISIFQIENGAKRQRDALTYLISELKSSGIEVVLIQMPLNPLANEAIPEESLDLFDLYIQELANTFNIKLIHAQDDYEPNHFTDLTHLNKEGSILFSKKIREGDYDIIQ